MAPDCPSALLGLAESASLAEVSSPTNSRYQGRGLSHDSSPPSPRFPSPPRKRPTTKG